VAPSVAVTGIDPNGNFTVGANLTSTINMLGFGGAVSGFVSLGGAVSFLTDTSSARAMVGANPRLDPTDTQISEAGSPKQATVITGFDDVSVTSDATLNHNLEDDAFSASGVAGLGAAIVGDTVTGTGQAIVGTYTQIGSATDSVGGTVTVKAQRTVNLNPLDFLSSSDPLGIAIGGGGILGVAAGGAIISITGHTTAKVDDNAQIYAAGDVDVEAIGTVTADKLEVDGGAIGGIAVGFVIAHATITPTVATSIGNNTVIRGPVSVPVTRPGSWTARSPCQAVPWRPARSDTASALRFRPP